jgi:FG-GAP-like repeat/FG-GAP repeat
MFAAPMDVDRRRGLDLIAGGKNERAAVGWLESPAQPRDVRGWRFHRLSEAGWIMSLLVRDMNRDGRPDILLTDRRGPLAGVRWLENPGADSHVLREPWRNHSIGARGREAMLLDAADLDGDGVAEIVVPHYLESDFGLSIFRLRPGSSGDAWTESVVRYPAIAGRPKAAAVGDIDRDGRPDVVLSAEEARGGKRGIVWLRFRDSPFNPEWDAFDVAGPEGVKFDLNLLVDVDADGDLDIVNTEENDNAAGGNAGLGIVWYENPFRTRPADR